MLAFICCLFLCVLGFLILFIFYLPKLFFRCLSFSLFCVFLGFEGKVFYLVCLKYYKRVVSLFVVVGFVFSRIRKGLNMFEFVMITKFLPFQVGFSFPSGFGEGFVVLI